jgi:methionyl-tRNA formyltransferase
MNLIFMGTPDFAVPSLELLAAQGYVPVAVVTGEDKPRGRGQAMSPTPVKECAVHHHLPILQPASLKDPAFAQQIRHFEPDLLVVVAFRILPREVFSLARRGSFNLHASLLPKYRGAAPINWAIIRGETETGVTTFFLEEKVDTGSIILQRQVAIFPDDDAGSLHDRLAGVGAEAVVETVRAIELGQVQTHFQEGGLATPAPKIFRDHCRINWAQSAAGVHNLVRGLSPYPAAFSMLAGKVVKVYRTQVLGSPASASPGSVTVVGEELHVSAADRDLAILDLQIEGRKRMTAAEFLRGHRLVSGDSLL